MGSPLPNFRYAVMLARSKFAEYRALSNSKSAERRMRNSGPQESHNRASTLACHWERMYVELLAAGKKDNRQSAAQGSRSCFGQQQRRRFAS